MNPMRTALKVEFDLGARGANTPFAFRMNFFRSHKRGIKVTLKPFDFVLVSYLDFGRLKNEPIVAQLSKLAGSESRVLKPR